MMSLILKQRNLEDFRLETDFVEILFIQETAIAFRRKDLDNRAFVGNRRLSVRETKLLNNWLNGQETSKVSEASVNLSVATASGTAIPNIAPVVDLPRRIDVATSGVFPVSHQVLARDYTVQDEDIPMELDFLWEQVASPDGQDATFSTSSRQPTFQFPSAGVYVMRLTVTEPDEGLTGSDEVRFFITDTS